MPYDPENNPYVPGDPYSYDLKWMVQEVKQAQTVITNANQAVADATAQAKAASDSANNAANSASNALISSQNAEASAENAAASAEEAAGAIAPLTETVDAQGQQITVLEGRMDTFSSLTEGSTTGDAELQDIRVAADGTVYPTAGDAVRAQVNNINGHIDKMLPLKTVPDFSWTYGKSVSSSGSMMNYKSTAITDMIPVHVGDQFINMSSATGTDNNNTLGFIIRYLDGVFVSREAFNAKKVINITDNANAVRIIFGYSVNTDITLTPEDLTAIFRIQIFAPVALKTDLEHAGMLTATGDDTDRSADIMAAIEKTGYCRLAEGTFYVSGNMDLPEGACIEGSGENTIIRLIDGAAGYVFRIQRYNTLSNFTITGADSTISSWTETPGTRHAIFYTANYDGTDGPTTSLGLGCRISNITIRNFTGYGIYARNTGMSTYQGIYISLVMIYACHTGVYFDYKSEFNKLANANIARGYIGVRNDSGNNGISNCTISAGAIGFLLDNSNDDKPNNGHGYLQGCSFCHIGDNLGSAITVKNSSAGYVFSNLQIHYNSIDVSDSTGVAFSNVEFGRGPADISYGGAKITINGGGLITFANCIFMNDVTYSPRISITGNNKVHFFNCYGAASGNQIMP